MIKQVVEDQLYEQKLVHIDQSLLVKIQISSYKKLFRVSSQKPKLSAGDFFHFAKKHIPTDLYKGNFVKREHIPEDLEEAKPEIEKESEILKLARKIEVLETRQCQSEMSIEEARQLIGEEGSDPIPFYVSEKLRMSIKEQLDEFLQVEQEAKTMLMDDEKPTIEKITDLLNKFKKLKIATPLQDTLQSMQDDHRLVTSQWKSICLMKERKLKETQPCNETIFMHKQLKRVVQIMEEDRFLCEDMQKVCNWFEDQRAQFQSVRQEVDQLLSSGEKMSIKKNLELQ